MPSTYRTGSKPQHIDPKHYNQSSLAHEYNRLQDRSAGLSSNTRRGTDSYESLKSDVQRYNDQARAINKANDDRFWGR